MPGRDFGKPPHDLDRLHAERLARLEAAEGAVVAIPTDYPDGYNVPRHRHSRAQLLHALTGAVLVTTDQGRWMVPPEHAMWIPAGVEHAVEMLGQVRMRSVYVTPDAISGLPETLRVVSLTILMESLIREAVALPPGPHASGRSALVVGLLLHEIPTLEPRPLALPFPDDPKLATLCRRFVEAPSPHATIDDWAGEAGMSRRTFTRHFRQHTGTTVGNWLLAERLALSQRLLESTDQPIDTIASLAGFGSSASLRQHFSKAFGVSPRHYRQVFRG